MGSMILPSDELPSTAWPCRVRHVRGQLTPSLEIDAAYFQRAINSLQHKKYGAMMQNYRPVADIDLFSALLDDDVFLEDDQHIEEDLHLINEKRELYQRWIDLHPTTKNNLLRFERSGYRIAEWASGHDHVVDLLAQVNDIIRLCRRLKVPLPTCRNIQYPLLKIEFEALRDEQFEGVFEFIDLPGVGESDDSFHSFEDLVRGVAKEVDAVVPVVSFKEVSKDDWRQQLPDIIKVAKDRVEEQMASVAKAFWPRKLDAQHRILGCSSRMGFSARSLLRHSRSAKPQFNEIWCEDAIEYDCAEKILGTHEPESTFHNLSFEVWNKAVSDQLTRSGLQSTIKRLVTEMVISSHQRALVEEGSRIAKQIRKAISNQHRLLLSMHRSTEAREQAYRTFEKARSDYQGVLAEWALTAADLQMTSSRKLKAGFQLLEREGTTVAYQAIENTEKANRTTLSAQRAEINDLGELVFQDVHAAEMFLQQVQVHMNKSLSYLKRKFVDFVRTLANRSRADHFASLKKRIQGFGTDDLHSILQGEIIEELTDRGSGMEALAFSTVRRKVMHTVATKHSAASAYRALQETIAKPLLKQKAIGAFQDTLSDSSSGSMDTSESFSRVEDLGFMLRAPIAVIAAVPWLFGSAIWPFMKNTEKFILNKDAFVTELKEHIIYPFFEALKQEGQNTLEQMMARSSEAARGAVRDALAMEEQQFESEQAVGNQSSSQTIGTALNTLLNLIAAEAALIKLQGLLKDIPSP
ncbi:hypothetical protein BV22DRAFT_268537 [Leucogyrophana mollusca]|uniref:Uncharacterized protein n=1 Tax=Leucogyrophana mollusca TaxID=85980 RepID=A0ACB8BNW2_9AGAM|nr:hypothetical protein BV22DRAFT_268537 [Leucogyrophana mollusca]